MIGDDAPLRVVQLLSLLLVAASGAGVVTTRDPTAQAVSVSFFGLMLTLMFFAFMAPDVALSQLVVGTIALPLMTLLTLAKVRRRERRRDARERRGEPTGPG